MKARCSSFAGADSISVSNLDGRKLSWGFRRSIIGLQMPDSLYNSPRHAVVISADDDRAIRGTQTIPILSSFGPLMASSYAWNKNNSSLYSFIFLRAYW